MRLPDTISLAAQADNINLTAHVEEKFQGKRLDWVAAQYFGAYSRSKLQNWIKSGQLSVNNQAVSIKYSVKAGDYIEVDATIDRDIEWQAVPHDVKPLFVDDDLMIINKPANLVVHPAAGHDTDTLVNGLLYEFPELRALPRAGIVHRLDKDTTGLMVVARSLEAHTSLVRQIEAREVKRKYQAIVQGQPIAGGTIDLAIGRHPSHRIKMAVRSNGAGKPAITQFRILDKFPGFSLLDVSLETGRTHQIRVHFAHKGMPILGDPLYGARLRLPKGCNVELEQALRNFKRQALHAYQLGFIHPTKNEWVQWEITLPQEIQSCCDLLKNKMTQN